MDQDARKALTPLKLREKAAKFAKLTVNIQKTAFKVISDFVFRCKVCMLVCFFVE